MANVAKGPTSSVGSDGNTAQGTRKALKAKEIARTVDALISHFADSFVAADPADDLSDLYNLVMDALEAQLIAHVMKRVDGNKVRAAHVLGIHRNTLAQKIEKMADSSGQPKQKIRAPQRMIRGNQLKAQERPKKSGLGARRDRSA